MNNQDNNILVSRLIFVELVEDVQRLRHKIIEIYNKLYNCDISQYIKNIEEYVPEYDIKVEHYITTESKIKELLKQRRILLNDLINITDKLID